MTSKKNYFFLLCLALSGSVWAPLNLALQEKICFLLYLALVGMTRVPPNLALQEKSPSFHGSTFFGHLLFFLPKLWLFPTLLWAFLAWDGRPLEVLSKKNLFLFIAWFLWKIVGRPLELWIPDCSLLKWRMREGTCYPVVWGPKPTGWRCGTPWTQAYGWECGWECGAHLLGLGRKCNTPG